MKKTAFTPARFIIASLAALTFGGVAIAQKQESPSVKSTDSEMTIRIIDRSGDEVRKIERNYRANGLSDSERDKLVNKLVDSLKTTRKKGEHHELTITVEDTNGDRTVRRERDRNKSGTGRLKGDAYVWSSPKGNSGAYFWNNQDWQRSLRRQTDSMSDQLKRFKFQMPMDVDRQLARPFEDWSKNFNAKPSTIRGLDAYPNNPDQTQLNVRFTAPAKGDINIIVTNAAGKEVAKRSIKNFSGEFLGQVDLGKKAQGTYFITVTQNEDGAVKRIVVDY